MDGWMDVVRSLRASIDDVTFMGTAMVVAIMVDESGC